MKKNFDLKSEKTLKNHRKKRYEIDQKFQLFWIRSLTLKLQLAGAGAGAGRQSRSRSRRHRLPRSRSRSRSRKNRPAPHPCPEGVGRAPIAENVNLRPFHLQPEKTLSWKQSWQI